MPTKLIYLPTYFYKILQSTPVDLKMLLDHRVLAYLKILQYALV